MRNIKKVFCAVAASAALAGMTVLSAFAAEPYTYTVTFYAGNQGTFLNQSGLTVSSRGSVAVQNEGSKMTVSGLLAGDVVSFDPQQGAVGLADDSRYYVQGIRPSARDNDMASLSASAFRVTEDADYVVAYGIQGDQVAYTVRYEDENGTELAPSRTYYGNVGDKPVVAYLYIENYLPEALALTKTLSADAAENVFTFVYTDAGPEVIVEPGDTVTVTTVIPGTNTVQTIQVPAQAAGLGGTAAGGVAGTGGAQATGGGTTGDAGTGAATGTTGDAGTTEENPGTQGETLEQDETPQGVVDLDENETPRDAGTDVVQDAEKKGFPLAAGIGIGAAGVVVLGVLLALIRKYRR